jgi:hypothetical protein
VQEVASDVIKTDCVLFGCFFDNELTVEDPYLLGYDIFETSVFTSIAVRFALIGNSLSDQEIS